MQTKLTLTLVIVLLASTLNPQASKAQTERSKRWAILIGVDSYNNAEDLKYCGDDMTALRKQLIASGFDEKRIFLLHNKAANTKYLPFKSNIEQQIELILKLTGPDDLVLLAYSGHGVQLGTTSYLCPTDVSLDVLSTNERQPFFGRPVGVFNSFRHFTITKIS